MIAQASETLFSATTLVWLAVSAAAVAILFGSINRRRTRLTDSLRKYVDRSQDGREAVQRSVDDDRPE